MATGSELCRWVDHAVEVSRQPVSAFPTVRLLRMLSETFEATVGWHWLDEDGAVGWDVVHAPARWPPPGAIEVWLSHQFDHPLHRWYSEARTPSPMTIGRVPEEVADRRLVAFAREALGFPDMTQQLAIPVTVTGRSRAVFVVNHGGRDFTDGQVLLAQQLQPLLMLLQRQASLSVDLSAAIGPRFGLTARECAVLGLLRQGLTAPAIASHLACAPRTVEKHLEHLYRKLGVRDRLDAVRMADAYLAATTNPHQNTIPRPRVASSLQGLVGGDDAGLLSFVGTLPDRARSSAGSAAEHAGATPLRDAERRPR